MLRILCRSLLLLVLLGGPLVLIAQPAQGQINFTMTSPDVKVVAYIKRFNVSNCITDMVSTNPYLSPAMGGVSAATAACAGLAFSANNDPPASFPYPWSWSNFDQSKEYRGYIHIPPVTIACAGTRVQSDPNQLLMFSPASYGYTKHPAPPPDFVGYSAGDVYTTNMWGTLANYNQTTVSVVGGGEVLQIVNQRASRLSNIERYIQAGLVYHDAPFIYTRLSLSISCRTRDVKIDVGRTTFPTVRLYIDNTSQNKSSYYEEAQTALGQFIVSGGPGYPIPACLKLLPGNRTVCLPALSPLGQGRLAPAGKSLSVTRQLTVIAPTAPPTSTRSATRTSTRTATSTRTSTRTATSLPSATRTSTRTSTRTATSLPSATRTPTRTSTRTATSLPSATRTATRSATPPPSTTPTATHTATSLPGATRTATRSATPSPSATPTPTATRTATSLPGATSTASATSTATRSQTSLPGDTPTATGTATPPNASLTPTPPSASATHTATGTGTSLPASTPTNTPSPTLSPTSTASRTPTATLTPTSTATPTATPTGTAIAVTPTPSPTALPPPANRLRVIEVRYLPDAPPYHPDLLSSQLQQLILNASRRHGYKTNSAPSVGVEVVAIYNHSGPRPNPDGSWYSTYQAILAQDNLCQQINSLEIDQVWLWVDPVSDPGPGLEYVISSPTFERGAQYATVASPAFCGGERSFVFMGYDVTRTVDNSLHSFGHAMEGLLGNIQSVELFWHRYGGNDSAGFPLSERCGNVHFPPNGTRDYDYTNSTQVDTFCEQWNPAGSGLKTRYGCERWGCSQAGFLTWWMQNMPNTGNLLLYQGKYLPSWWDFTYDLDANIARYLADPMYYMNPAFFNPYPYGIIRVDTDPVVISQKNLTALFDRVYHWPNTAVINYQQAPLGVLMEFANPVNLSGFTATVAGSYGDPSAYSWTVAMANSWEDMLNRSGSYGVIVSDLNTLAGVVNLPFRGGYTAKVFKVTATRRDLGGAVHILELAPTFSGQLPAIYQSVETSPVAINGTKYLPGLFDGFDEYQGFAIIHHTQGESVGIILDYGSHNATWTGLVARVGGEAGNPNGQLWRIEMANNMADLNSQTGSYRLVLTNSSSDSGYVNLDFAERYTGRVFKVTLTRNDALDTVEHVAELAPKVEFMDYLP